MITSLPHYKLGDIADIIGGGTPSKNIKEYYNGSILWASVRDMKNETLDDTEFKITEKALEESSSKIIPKDNIIIATRVGLGKVCMLAKDTAINQDLKGIIPKDKKVISKYLFYWFKSISKILEENGTGATVKGVQVKFISNLQIPLPPLEEQRRIVGKLDGLFGKIDKSIALLDESIASASALMPSALNEVFEELGEKWEKKTLKDITTKIGSGATPSGGDKSYKESGISLIRSMNVHDNEFRSKNLAFIDDEQAKKLNNVSVQENDVLLNITGASVARCCIVDSQYLPARVNQHVSIIRLKNDILPQFIQYYLVNPNTKNELLFNAGGGATREAITKKMIEDFEIPLPPLEIQTQTVTYLDALHVKAQALKKAQVSKKEELLALKASLLESAFKGEL